MFIMLAIVALVLVLAILYVFSFFFPFFNEKYSEHYVGTYDSVIIVSDVHVGAQNSLNSTLGGILRKTHAEVLVIAGDLIDHGPALRSSKSLSHVIRAIEILSKDSRFKRIIYVPSHSSHDPLFPRNIILRIRRSPEILLVTSRGILLRSRNQSIHVTHGDYVCRNGALAFITNMAARQLFGISLFLEKLLKRVLGIPWSHWLVMGHTHIGGIDHEHHVANCGSWRRYWREPVKGLVKVDKGLVSFHAF
ncbi:MAG: hypothetical protein DRJ51_05385 [Thermoprotei archaeon]|nr:MAG: hypothetical protein DRJ51_05385 [Thermoprotei archaeon]RLF01414.1 MAG: hypothetical protein DRJ59_06095 [Thermoprotei archaeon]